MKNSNNKIQIDFHDKYIDAAILASKGSGIFPGTILSTAALESGWNQSKLSKLYNNFFGIKAGKNWKGNVVKLPTKEQHANGSTYTILAKFRVFASAKECFGNYIEVVTQPRYIKAGILNANSAEEQFSALKRGGYATDVNYVSKLKSILKYFSEYSPEFGKNNPGKSLSAEAFLFIFFSYLFLKKTG